MLECVVNVSEGRRPDVIDGLAAACGADLLDVHSDPHHNRSVFTTVGTAAARALARVAVERLDIRAHEGVHPRIGVVDVVPFVPLAGSTMADAIEARDDFAAWMASELAVPCFVYGPERSLPEVRRGAFRSVAPDCGPTSPHVTAGACAVGARGLMVAYNLFIDGDARGVAAAVRQEGVVRALGFDVGGRPQVSCNLIAPDVVGPAEVYDAVAALAAVTGTELVGLVPQAVLDRIPSERWALLGLSAEKTI